MNLFDIALDSKFCSELADDYTYTHDNIEVNCRGILKRRAVVEKEGVFMDTTEEQIIIKVRSSELLFIPCVNDQLACESNKYIVTEVVKTSKGQINLRVVENERD